LGRFGQTPELSQHDWYGSGTLHPGQVLRGSLPLLSPSEKNIEHKMCFDFTLQRLSETFVLVKTEPDIVIKCTRFSCQIFMKLEFYQQIFEKKYLSDCMTIRPVGADLFHADGETEVTELIVAYRNFAKETKIELEMIEVSK